MKLLMNILLAFIALSVAMVQGLGGTGSGCADDPYDEYRKCKYGYYHDTSTDKCCRRISLDFADCIPRDDECSSWSDCCNNLVCSEEIMNEGENVIQVAFDKTCQPVSKTAVDKKYDGYIVQ